MGTASQIITPLKNKPQLEKAMLIAYKDEAEPIKLMFNPTEINFARSVKWEPAKASGGKGLLPKINFSSVEPYKLNLKQLLFDTYETKMSVMKYIDIIKAGVTPEKSKEKRPPVYIFTWGKEKYFHCVITSLSYTLTMFLTDGTPVRAMVDISLQEVEENNIPGGKPDTPKGKNRGDAKVAPVPTARK